MSWSFTFSDLALKQLRKLDPPQRNMLVLWLDKNLQGCDNPRAFGKVLVANRKEQWRYRIGDYRVLCEIRDNDCVIVAIEVGHRRSIYR